MNKMILSAALAAAFTLAAQTAAAHDPKEHEKETAGKSAAPDCAQMKEMDMSKMDMNDPVMLAMQQKCMGQMEHGGMAGMDHHAADPKATGKSDEHQH